MKKLVVIVALALLVSATAYANNNNWMVFVRGSTTTYGSAGSQATFGVATNANDEYDALDSSAGSYPAATNTANYFYRPGWPAPSWYMKDTKLPVAKDSIKWWKKLYVAIGSSWYDTGAGRGILRIGTWLSTSTYAIDRTLHNYTLIIADDPTGVHQGERYTFTQSYGGATNAPLKYWDWNLTDMGADNRAKITSGGYTDLQTKHIEIWLCVPEPASLLALASGMAGLAGFVLKRRKTIT